MSKDTKAAKKLGRDEEISPDELLRRYAALKRFLEDNWGRIGLDLPRVRQPDDVKSILNRVPDAHWLPAFRDFPMGCLLKDGSEQVSWRKVRETREKYNEAKLEEGRLSLESYNAHLAAQNARTAFEAAAAEYKEHQDAKKAQDQLQNIAKQLRIEELTNQAKELGTSLRDAHKNREFLEALLASQEARFARNEVVGFARDRKKRYRKSPENFAKALAGLPFYDWLYSVRKCISMPGVKNVPTTYWFQVFTMLEAIVKRTTPAILRKVELKLRNQLLKQDADSLLRSYIGSQWYYMTKAFADCRGKGFNRKKIPYKIMERFLDHCERHSVADAELAKYNQLPG
jgi:hypothetical protein